MRRIVIFIVMLIVTNMAYSQIASFILRGDSLKKEQEYEKAIESYIQARQSIHQKNLKDSNSYVVRIMNEMAGCYQKQGEYKKALNCFQHLNNLNLLDIRGKLNLSNIYLLLGFYEKTIELLEPLTPSLGEENRILNLASAYAYLNKTDKALELLETPLDEKVSPTALSNKGFIELSVGQFTSACQSMNKALSMIDDCPDKYIVMANLALAESEIGNHEKALLHIDSCLVWQQKHLGERHPDYAISIRKKAEILLKAEKKSQALLYFKSYFQYEKDYVKKNFAFMTEKQRQDFWFSRKDLISECFMTEKEDPDFLYNVALFSKSILLQVNKDLGQLANKKPQTATLYSKIKQLRRILSQQKLSGKEYSEIEKEADEKEQELMLLLKDYREFASYFNITLQDIKRAMKKDTDVSIEFIQYKRGGQTFYAALIAGKNKKTEFVSLFTKSELENYKLKNGSSLKQAITSGHASDKNSIYTDTILGSFLFNPLSNYIQPNTSIYFAPDGLLHLLAIEHLNFKYTDCTFFRLTSTRELTFSNTSSNKSIMLFGGLDYNNCVDIINSDSSADRSASDLLSELHFPPVENGQYEYLPHTLLEVDSIKKLFSNEKSPISQIKKFEGKEGSERNFKKYCEKFTVIHLATHGFCILSPDISPLLHRKDSLSEELSLSRCGLIFAGANKLSNPSIRDVEDGILLAKEACELGLSASELIVLSACQTGLGEITTEGVSGLQRGLKKAGARSLLMSLWNVNDEATRILMIAFYKSLLEGRNKSEALLQAQKYVENFEKTIEFETGEEDTTQQQIRKLGRWVYPSKRESKRIKPFQAPEYWAGFILLDGI